MVASLAKATRWLIPPIAVASDRVFTEIVADAVIAT
jgi:hypothetical protein